MNNDPSGQERSNPALSNPLDSEEQNWASMSHVTPQMFQSEDQRRGRHPGVRFTISVPGSENSSRASSRAPSPLRKGGDFSSNDDFSHVNATSPPSPGRRSADVYGATLPWWRATVRRKLLVAVQRESKVIARVQVCVVSPFFRPCSTAFILIRTSSGRPGSTPISYTHPP